MIILMPQSERHELAMLLSIAADLGYGQYEFMTKRVLAQTARQTLREYEELGWIAQRIKILYLKEMNGHKLENELAIDWFAKKVQKAIGAVAPGPV